MSNKLLGRKLTSLTSLNVSFCFYTADHSAVHTVEGNYNKQYSLFLYLVRESLIKSVVEQMDNSFLTSEMKFGWISVTCNYGTWQVMDVTVLPSVRPFVNRMWHATVSAVCYSTYRNTGIVRAICSFILLYLECWCGYWISKHFLFNIYLFLQLTEKSLLMFNSAGLNKILCQCTPWSYMWGVEA
jgi:hypothetical protein